MTPRHHRAAGTPSAGNSGERTPMHPWNGRVDAALPRQSRGMAAISRADEDRVKKIAVPARNPLCQSLISARSPMALPYRAPLWRSLKAPRNVFTRCSPIPTALPTARRPARRHSDAACGDRRRAEEIERVGQRTHGFPASWPQGLDGDLGSASGHRFLRWQPQQRSAPIAGRGEGVPRRPAASRPTWDGTAATPDGGSTGASQTDLAPSPWRVVIGDVPIPGNHAPQGAFGRKICAVPAPSRWGQWSPSCRLTSGPDRDASSPPSPAPRWRRRTHRLSTYPPINPPPCG